jgi:hypothetical protein
VTKYVENIGRRSIACALHLNCIKILIKLKITKQTRWTFSIVHVLIENDVSDTGICFRPEVKPTQLGPTDRPVTKIGGVLLPSKRCILRQLKLFYCTMDNVQNNSVGKEV